MTAKEYLEQAQKIEKRINSLVEQVQGLRDFSLNCTSQLTGLPNGTSKSTSHIADAVCRMTDSEREIAEEIQRLSEVRDDIRRLIDSVDDPDCHAVLTKRYLRYKQWNDIIREMGYCKSTVYNIHLKGLEIIAQKLNL